VSDVPKTLVTRSADGTTLAYYVFGSGPSDLVWMENAMPVEPAWDDPDFRRTLTRLATFSRVIMVEARGVGASEGDPRDVFVPGAVSDADLLAVMDAAGAERAVLVGDTSNGQYAIQFAATHPQRVDALILIDTYAHYVREDDYPRGFPRARLDDVTAFLERSWGTDALLELGAPSRATDERLRVVWGRGVRSRGPSVNAEVIRRSLEWDGRGLLPSISCRTLVLHREGDRLIHLGAGRYLAEHIARAEFVMLPGEDYVFFVGDTDALVDEIEEFVIGTRAALRPTRSRPPSSSPTSWLRPSARPGLAPGSGRG
jgi:pimeloyl-ACP methyl ester carboxylesterase